MVLLSHDERARLARRRRNVRNVFVSATVSLLAIGGPAGLAEYAAYSRTQEIQSVKNAYTGGLREADDLQREHDALGQKIKAALAEYQKSTVLARAAGRDVHRQWETTRDLAAAKDVYDKAQQQLAAQDNHERERRRGCREAVVNIYRVAPAFRAACRGLNREPLGWLEMIPEGGINGMGEDYINLKRRVTELFRPLTKRLGY